MKFNLNQTVTIKPTDKGIHLMVERYNIVGLPTKFHTNYEKEKSALNNEGEITMQIHMFMAYFGNLGFSLPDYVDINVELSEH